MVTVTGEHDVGGFLNPSFNGSPGTRGRGVPEEWSSFFTGEIESDEWQLKKNQFRRSTLIDLGG